MSLISRKNLERYELHKTHIGYKMHSSVFLLKTLKSLENDQLNKTPQKYAKTGQKINMHLENVFT